MAQNPLRRTAWAAVSVAVPIAGGIGVSQFASAGVRDPDQSWWWIAAAASGIAALGVAVAAKIADARRNPTLDTARQHHFTEIADELIPFAATAAEMARQPAAERYAYLKSVAVAVTSGLRTLVSGHVERPRAVVYLLDAEEQSMASIAQRGRGDRPRPFLPGTPRGDAALRFVDDRRTAFYPDLAKKTPPGYDGSRAGYRTFIAVPIWTDAGVYGMVTLDAPTAGSFDRGDVALVEFAAELMSIPFEIAQDQDAPPPRDP